MRHHRLNRIVERNSRQDDPLENIGMREDADRLLVGIDDDHRTDIAIGHQFDGHLDRRIRRDRNGILVNDRRQRRIHRLLLGNVLGELQLQLLARLAEQTGEVLRTEEIEHRTLLHQQEESLGRQFVAENILKRRINARRGSLCRHRPDRKPFARPQRQR